MSAKYGYLVPSAQARNAIGDAMRLFMGRGRRHSVADVSIATGIPEWMLHQAMIDGDDVKYRHLPPEALISLSRFLGADFVNRWIPLANLGVFDLPDERCCPGDIAADNTDDNAKIVRAAMDMVFDETETPDLVQVGNRMMQRGAHLVALGRSRPPQMKGE